MFIIHMFIKQNIYFYIIIVHNKHTCSTLNIYYFTKYLLIYYYY